VMGAGDHEAGSLVVSMAMATGLASSRRPATSFTPIAS
jgi:hypothetical protein